MNFISELWNDFTGWITNRYSVKRVRPETEEKFKWAAERVKYWEEERSKQLRKKEGEGKIPIKLILRPKNEV
jgi:hypothetical protein